jgi:hypothetical protein
MSHPPTPPPPDRNGEILTEDEEYYADDPDEEDPTSESFSGDEEMIDVEENKEVGLLGKRKRELEEGGEKIESPKKKQKKSRHQIEREICMLLNRYPELKFDKEKNDLLRKLEELTTSEMEDLRFNIHLQMEDMKRGRLGSSLAYTFGSGVEKVTGLEGLADDLRRDGDITGLFAETFGGWLFGPALNIFSGAFKLALHMQTALQRKRDKTEKQQQPENGSQQDETSL